MNCDFHNAYGALEERMKAQAESDGNVYLPNPKPSAPVQYVLICEDPSLGGWARDHEDARDQVAKGFRNFLASTPGINILHFCARRYLCGPTDRYHITDMAKGAMWTEEAKVQPERRRRWDRWFPLLEDEIDLCATANAQFIAVGREVSDYVFDNLRKPLTRVIHYSPRVFPGTLQAAIANREASFERFKDTVSIQDILAAARATFCQANLRPDLQERWLGELEGRRLTDSHRKLIFHYKTKFESMRTPPRPPSN
jgi:hypothetical protein